MDDSRARLRVGVVIARSRPGADGIRDYACLLVRTLKDSGLSAALFEWPDRAPRKINCRVRGDSSFADVSAADVLVLQYNPFSFGRWGFAPGLPLFLARLRRGPHPPRIVVMFHELYVDVHDLSSALMGSWQRAQLLAVQATADIHLCSIQRWTERLRTTALGRPVHHMPVASNLPDARADREPTRQQLGADAGTLVLSCIGLRHPHRLEEHVLASARLGATAARSVLLVNLGPGERSTVRLAQNVSLCSTGFLHEYELAKRIAASDFFLAPLVDGVSTRRTSVMAALQHGVPVIGTVGHLTDDVLLGAPGIVLVELGCADGFAHTVARLARDPTRRAKMGAEARGLYEREFDWPVLAERLRGHIHV